jgi:hypothetical protein
LLAAGRSRPCLLLPIGEPGARVTLGGAHDVGHS